MHSISYGQIPYQALSYKELPGAEFRGVSLFLELSPVRSRSSAKEWASKRMRRVAKRVVGLRAPCPPGLAPTLPPRLSGTSPRGREAHDQQPGGDPHAADGMQRRRRSPLRESSSLSFSSNFEM